MRGRLLDAFDWLSYWILPILWVLQVLALTAVLLLAGWDFVQQLGQGSPKAPFSLGGTVASGLLLYRLHQYKQDSDEASGVHDRGR